MYSSSRGILYTAPPAEGDRTEDGESTATDAGGSIDADADESPTGDATEVEPTVEDVTPAASRADWTGDLPADD